MNISLTFDDVLLKPQKSEVMPSEISVRTNLTKNIQLATPILSSPMDKVTKAEMAVALARLGGIGIIHRNLSIEEQVEEIKKVKRAESYIIQNPVTISPDQTLKEMVEIVKLHKVSGLPVVDNDNTLEGIITRRDLYAATSLNQKVSEVMTGREKLVTAFPGVSLSEAERVLRQNRLEKLPLVDENYKLKGLITFRDIIQIKKYPQATKDKKGRLMVGGAVGVGQEAVARAGDLIKAGADVLVIDTAHGHSKNVIDTLANIKNNWPDIEVIVGNVAAKEGVKDLAAAGADAIKIGVGAGSICITRVVSGAGVPQFSAVLECASEANKLGIPAIADGGIRQSGDIVKSLAAGASSVMLGNLLAGTEEAPGEKIFLDGRVWKVYRGMGSLGAMTERTRDRYDAGNGKVVPEGIEGRVPFRGPLREVVYQLIGGVKSGMGYCGAKDISELQKKAVFQRITTHGVRESHPHEVVITAEAPNYF